MFRCCSRPLYFANKNFLPFLRFASINRKNPKSQVVEFKGIHEYRNEMRKTVARMQTSVLSTYKKIFKIKSLKLDEFNSKNRVSIEVDSTTTDLFINEREYDLLLIADKFHEKIIDVRDILNHETINIDKVVQLELLPSDKDSLKNLEEMFNNDKELYFIIAPNCSTYKAAFTALRTLPELNYNFLLRPSYFNQDNINKLNSLSSPNQTCNLDQYKLLNDSQKFAINHSLNKDISIIQGPPGTGKTYTAAILVSELAKTTKGKILVCAASNIAVDNISDKMYDMGLNVFRKVSSVLPYEKATRKPYYSQSKLNMRILESGDQELIDMHERFANNQFVYKSEFEEYRTKTFKYLYEEVANTQIICTTCTAASNEIISCFNYDYVVIDEAAQPMEAESLIPISLASKKVVLIGDHKQLGPFYNDSAKHEIGLSTLYERLMKLGVKPIMLDTQYRMHPKLAEFSSKEFYEGKLKSGVSVEDSVDPSFNYQWPNSEYPVYFKVVLGVEKTNTSSMSHSNELEAVSVIDTIKDLVKCGAKAADIGVISPYVSQRNLIRKKIERIAESEDASYENVDVSSVSAFQGREKNYIILSCVRSNDDNVVGFLVIPEQINVAITRAKYGLIIIGNPFVLKNSPIWKDYLEYFSSKGLVFQGDYPNMTVVDNL